MLNESNDQPMSKKSLINSFENFQSKVNQLAEVKESSYKMIRKFQRIDNEPMNKVEKGGKVLTPVKSDIIDLFNDLTDELQKLIIDIGNNIDRMTDWIE